MNNNSPLQEIYQSRKVTMLRTFKCFNIYDKLKQELTDFEINELLKRLFVSPSIEFDACTTILSKPFIKILKTLSHKQYVQFKSAYKLIISKYWALFITTFLETKNAKQNLINNLHYADGEIKTIEDFVEFHIKSNINICSMFSSCFIWIETNDGFDFWRATDLFFQQTIREL